MSKSKSYVNSIQSASGLCGGLTVLDFIVIDVYGITVNICLVGALIGDVFNVISFKFWFLSTLPELL